MSETGHRPRLVKVTGTFTKAKKITYWLPTYFLVLPMRHTYREVDTCGVRMALKLLAGKWTPIILYHLVGGPLRFTELWHEIPRVSKKVLTAQLRQLEVAGLIARTVHNGFPPEVSYQFTPTGNGLVPIMQSLDEWAMMHLAGAIHLSSPELELAVSAQPSQDTHSS